MSVGNMKNITEVCVNGKMVDFYQAGEEMLRVYNSLDKKTKKRAIKFLSKKIPQSKKEFLREEIKKDELWWCQYHFNVGMYIRNLLRDNGYGEKEFGITNLDDIYIQLLVDAIKY